MREEDITDNLRLAVYLHDFAPEARLAEYARLLPELKFKVKSFGYLMKKYEQWKGRHGSFHPKD